MRGFNVPYITIDKKGQEVLAVFKVSPSKEVSEIDIKSIVNIDGFYTDDFYRQQKWAILQNVIVINNNKIKANFEQQYFTIATGWKTCILTAIFTKK